MDGRGPGPLSLSIRPQQLKHLEWPTFFSLYVSLSPPCSPISPHATPPLTLRPPPMQSSAPSPFSPSFPASSTPLLLQLPPWNLAIHLAGCEKKKHHLFCTSQIIYFFSPLSVPSFLPLLLLFTGILHFPIKWKFIWNYILCHHYVY